MIEYDKTIMQFLDNGYQKDKNHENKNIFNLFGDGDFPSSEAIPIIFEDIWFPPE